MSFKGLVPLTITLERSEVITFAFPIDRVENILAIKNPEDAVSFAVYLGPMKPLTWITIGLLCLICPVFLTVAAR